ncbi:MAG: cytochrome P460 family protein [Bacteroidales bacterium]|nr:MAG: cytochrome P460 family protein [Bacteroidales bacterium]
MKTSIKYFVIGTFFIALFACEKETETATDKELYQMATTNIQSFVWYKNSNALLNRSSGSGHTQPYLRTRYNTIAAEVLNDQGKVIEGSDFPEGSLIVKELIGSNEQVEIYAILYKKSDHQYADNRGWVWGYIEEDGKVKESASKRGSACITCHSQTGNIDYMLMNKYFP